MDPPVFRWLDRARNFILERAFAKWSDHFVGVLRRIPTVVHRELT
jgi:hypothetical protein